MNINSNLLRQNLSYLIKVYPFIRVQTIGNSVLGKPIYAVRLGKGPNKVFYSGSIHANEFITTSVLMKFIEDYAYSYANGLKLYDYPVRKLFQTTSIYIVPMVNPDGVDLVTGNIAISSPNYQKALHIANDFPKFPFPDGWKANINGVDLKNYQPFSQSLVFV